jgi:hypothetical protein
MPLALPFDGVTPLLLHDAYQKRGFLGQQISKLLPGSVAVLLQGSGQGQDQRAGGKKRGVWSVRVSIVVFLKAVGSIRGMWGFFPAKSSAMVRICIFGYLPYGVS